MGEEDLITVPIEIDEQTNSTIRDTLQEWQHRITEAEENEVQTYSTIRNVLPHWQEGEFSAAHAESDSTQIYVDNDFQGSLTNSSTLTLRAHPIDPDIVFYVGDTVRLKITKDGFFVQGEQVSAGHKIYDAFCQWMAMNTGRPIEKDPIIKSSFAPLLSRYDLLKKPKD